MPHINRPLDAEGCVLDFHVGVSSQREAALRAANQPVRPPVPIRALIDTGASATVIDESVLRQLGLAPTGTVQILTPSTRGVPITCMAYDIKAGIYHPAHSLVLGTFPVIAGDFTGQTISALIGRDVLRNCLFIYDGVALHFTIAF
jgi:hypothetical protein